jgi:hypothetical protein
MGGSALVALGLAFPFLEIGSSSRSAYSAVRAARNLEVLDGPARAAFGVIVLLLPMLVGGVTLASALSWRWIAATLGGLVGTLGVVVGSIGLWASGAELIGPMIVCAGGALAVLGAALAVTERSSAKRVHKHEQPTQPVR